MGPSNPLVPNRQQTITWINVNQEQVLWCHIASLGHSDLTCWSLLTHICVIKQIRSWLVACSVPNHCLNQYQLSNQWQCQAQSSIKFEANTNTFISRKCIWSFTVQINGLGQDCSISSVSAMEILQSCYKPGKGLFVLKCNLKLIILFHWIIFCRSRPDERLSTLDRHERHHHGGAADYRTEERPRKKKDDKKEDSPKKTNNQPSSPTPVNFSNHPGKGLHYRKTSDICRTLVGNKIVDNSDVVGASPVGAAPTTSSFSNWHLASMDWAKTTARGYKTHLIFGIWCDW